MDIIKDLYYPNQGLCHFAIGLLVFGGLGRIAFWRDDDGLRVGGMLAVGLALLLTIAIIIWADENGRRISEWGHFAAGLVTMSILMLGWRAFTKSRDL